MKYNSALEHSDFRLTVTDCGERALVISADSTAPGEHGYDQILLTEEEVDGFLYGVAHAAAEKFGKPNIFTVLEEFARPENDPLICLLMRLRLEALDDLKNK